LTEEYLIFVAIAPIIIVMLIAFFVIAFRTLPSEQQRKKEIPIVHPKTWMTMEKEYERLKAKGLLDE
jgi:hypothetical protein